MVPFDFFFQTCYSVNTKERESVDVAGSGGAHGVLVLGGFSSTAFPSCKDTS